MKADLIAWMDRLQVSPEDLARRAGVTVKTVYNWRTTGVPKRKEEHLRRLMQTWTSSPESIGGSFVLRPTAAQFRQWNLAALDAGQVVEDWILAALDELSEPGRGPKGKT